MKNIETSPDLSHAYGNNVKFNQCFFIHGGVTLVSYPHDTEHKKIDILVVPKIC